MVFVFWYKPHPRSLHLEERASPSIPLQRKGRPRRLLGFTHRDCFVPRSDAVVRFTKRFRTASFLTVTRWLDRRDGFLCVSSWRGTPVRRGGKPSIACSVSVMVRRGLRIETASCLAVTLWLDKRDS